MHHPLLLSSEDVEQGSVPFHHEHPRRVLHNMSEVFYLCELITRSQSPRSAIHRGLNHDRT